MYLLIDMSQFDQIHLAFFDIKNRIDKIFEGRNRELLFSIDCMRHDVLNIWGKDENIEGIMVVVGAGSFTSTRIAVVVANTFSYVNQIVLLTIQEYQIENIQNLIPQLLKQKQGYYISATYSGEPNIGIS